jgi:signal transduction histidine kinase
MVLSWGVADPMREVSAPEDGKGRLISIFVGAVLLPSLALSYVSIDFVPELAKGRQAFRYKQAERTLYYVEKDLAQSAQTQAIEAARALGADRLLDGRLQTIAPALKEAGLDWDMFTSLRLEGSSPGRRVATKSGSKWSETPREVLSGMDPMPHGSTTEDAVPWVDTHGTVSGLLRYRYSPEFVHRRLIPRYFEKEFPNPDQSLVVRVSKAEGGETRYETAPTPDGTRFEVNRAMESPSFRGLKLALRYKDSSIEKDVRWWEMGTLAIIGFIDLMLAAGLYLVYSNVRRELHLARLKSDFVANVSHELKTPLALIRLFAETLELGRVPSEEKAHQYYRVINKESHRLTQLINNILDFSRIEAGRKEYRFAPTDVARVVRDVIESYRFQIEQQGFELKVDVADDLPQVPADAEALGQAVINLVNNAIKYSRESRTIHIQVRREGPRILVSVTDRGIGIPRGEQKKIFDKFYRGEDSLVHETKGSGLGLALVRHIMEAHSGSVDVESTAGKGSTFTLSLPVGKS